MEQRIANWLSLGAVVKSMRTERGLTQQALAEQAGVSRAWLAKVEAGHRGAEFEQITRTLTALGVSLIARTDDPSADEDALTEALRQRRRGRGRHA